MVLQDVLLELSNVKELYNNVENGVEQTQDGLSFDKGAVWKTNTYFNSFSIGKWMKYCSLMSISLELEVRGKFVIKAYHAMLSKDKVEETNLFTCEINSEEKHIYRYDVPTLEDGVVYFTLEAKEMSAICYSARYVANAMDVRRVKLALNICTYRREKYLLRNIDLLQKAFLDNKDSELHENLEVFVTDNGNTLDIESLQKGGIHAVYNPNVGGAGGFTRGLIEINNCKEEKSITHAIFMDDDVEIEPEAILRTYRLLKILKPEYHKAFISGAMMRLDMKYVQHESGALWNVGKCRFVNRGLDLREFRNVIYNEIEQKRDYAAWWYCCVPTEVIRKDNLPIPIFIHQDDTEYSLRNTEHIITMNGIAIWHEASEHKRISTNEYYNLRNLLVVNARYCSEFGLKEVKQQVLSRMLAALLRLQYKDMQLIYLAVEDFCRGPKWLCENDSVGLHKELQSLGYKLTDVTAEIKGRTNNDKDDIIIDPFEVKKKRWTFHKIVKLFGRAITLNGWILPPKKDCEIHFMNVHPAKLYRVGKVVLYDDASNAGVVLERQWNAIWEFVSLYTKANRLLKNKYEKSKMEYNQSFRELCNYDTWNRHLKIEG